MKIAILSTIMMLVLTSCGSNTDSIDDTRVKSATFVSDAKKFTPPTPPGFSKSPIPLQ